jgi:hypothetical protein
MSRNVRVLVIDDHPDDRALSVLALRAGLTGFEIGGRRRRSWPSGWCGRTSPRWCARRAWFEHWPRCWRPPADAPGVRCRHLHEQRRRAAGRQGSAAASTATHEVVGRLLRAGGDGARSRERAGRRVAVPAGGRRRPAERAAALVRSNAELQFLLRHRTSPGAATSSAATRSSSPSAAAAS